MLIACHVILKPWCLLPCWIPHIWSHASDSSRPNLHLRSLGWRTMSLYPLGLRLSIQRECRSFAFLRQNVQIQPFTPSKPRTLWERLYLILKSELQVKTKKTIKCIFLTHSNLTVDMGVWVIYWWIIILFSKLKWSDKSVYWILLNIFVTSVKSKNNIWCVA